MNTQSMRNKTQTNAKGILKDYEYTSILKRDFRCIYILLERDFLFGMRIHWGFKDVDFYFELCNFFFLIVCVSEKEAKKLTKRN